MTSFGAGVSLALLAGGGELWVGNGEVSGDGSTRTASGGWDFEASGGWYFDAG
jgi:hypothetical protein